MGAARSLPQSADRVATRAPTKSAAAFLQTLWIDDEITSADATVRLLGWEGVQVMVAPTAAEGLRQAVATACDVILLDLQLPDMFGLTALRRLRAVGVSTPVVVITGHYMEPEVETEARRLGACEFLHKPLLDLEELVKTLRLAATGPSADAVVPSPVPRYGVIAASEAMRDVLAWVEIVSRQPIPVLLTGETGTGKEVVAHAIHMASGRPGRFVAINCGAIPETLFESELFGHAKGAFSGASAAKPGLCEEAEGGTLFLDEVSELPAAAQVRLLRAVDGHEVRRLGETRGRVLDVRVIAATNSNLREDVARRRFREDLYYRLNGASRHIPPLRERPEDIEALARYWATGYRATAAKRPISVGADALKVLRAQPYRGNARELRNLLERAVCLLSGPELSAREVVAALSETEPWPRAPEGTDTRRARAVTALRVCGGKAGRAAGFLGISRATLYRWLRQGGPPNDDGGS